MRFNVLTVSGAEPPRWERIEASSVQAVHARVAQAGGAVLAARPAAFGWLTAAPHQARKLDVAMFCAQMGALLRAGLSVPEALTALHANERSDGARATLAGIREAVTRGESLGEALAAQSGEMPSLLIAMVRASERTSGVPEALERYRTYANQVQALLGKVRTAAVYPLFLAVIGGIVILFLLTYVVPRFAGVYEASRGALPLAARVLFAWGQAIKGHAGLVWIAGGVAASGVAFAMRSAQVRSRVLERVLTAPGVASLASRVRLARLYRTLAMLLQAGVPVNSALAQCVEVLPAALGSDVTRARLRVSQGLALSAALLEVGATTPVSHGLLVAGERSGELGSMCDEAAVFLELETARAIDALMRVIEPAIMTVIGLAIGVIVVLMYLPIFELAGSLQ